MIWHLVSLGLLLATSTAAVVAEDAPAWTWLRAESGNGAYSVEVPCTAAEVELHTAMLTSANVRVPAAEREERAAAMVACRRGGGIFTVQLVTPRDLEPSVPAYDQIVNRVRASLPIAGLEVNESTHDGRRMLTSRQQSGGTIGKTGIIEVSDRSYLLLVAGSGNGETVTDEQIDRFFQSVELASS